jgi:plasmid stabilization system protein ParE
MTDYRFTPEAEDDLFEIWRYIARDSVAAANRACFFLRRAGTAASMSRAFQFTSGRFSSTPNYVVVYRPETRPLEIVRVLHGMRDIERLLKS